MYHMFGTFSCAVFVYYKSFHKMYGLYDLKHHIVEIRGDGGRMANEQTTEDRATQPMEAGG